MSERGLDMSSMISLRILTGILLGPVDFDSLREEIIIFTSQGVTAERKKELGTLFFKKEVKCLLEKGMVSRIEDAIEPK